MSKWIIEKMNYIMGRKRTVTFTYNIMEFVKYCLQKHLFNCNE